MFSLAVSAPNVAASPVRNSLPYAVLAALPSGPVSPAHAALLFGEHYNDAANYFADGRYVRRIVGNEEARTSGLRFVFNGKRCAICGTYSTRKVRSEPRGTECLTCIKRREAYRKQLKNEE